MASILQCSSLQRLNDVPAIIAAHEKLIKECGPKDLLDDVKRSVEWLKTGVANLEGIQQQHFQQRYFAPYKIEFNALEREFKKSSIDIGYVEILLSQYRNKESKGILNVLRSIAQELHSHFWLYVPKVNTLGNALAAQSRTSQVAQSTLIQKELEQDMVASKWKQSELGFISQSLVFVALDRIQQREKFNLKNILKTVQEDVDLRKDLEKYLQYIEDQYSKQPFFPRYQEHFDFLKSTLEPNLRGLRYLQILLTENTNRKSTGIIEVLTSIMEKEYGNAAVYANTLAVLEDTLAGELKTSQAVHTSSRKSSEPF